MQMQSAHGLTHEDLIDEYLLDRLSGSHLAALEEHLLVCEPCQQGVVLAETFALGMRAAMMESQAKPQVFTAGS